MENDYIKELFSTHRNDKMILTYYLIASLGGTIGLIFRFIYIKQGIAEAFFAILGIILSGFFIYSISNISERILKSINLLKKKKGE
jgi:ABC-type polysaccharide/polyol phosphate export permease